MKNSFFFFFLILPVLLNSYIFEVDQKESIYLLSTALTLDLANNYFDRKLFDKPEETELSKLDWHDVPFFDRWTKKELNDVQKKYSDYAVYLSISSALFIAYEPDKAELLKNLTVFSEIMIFQSALAKWTKTLTQRYRPYVYNEDVDLEKQQQRNSKHSFYSMHSSTAFAAATFGYYYYTQNFGKNLLSATILYGSAVATAYFRVGAGHHFPSDVVAGALVGSGISYLICHYHQQKDIELKISSESMKISYKF